MEENTFMYDIQATILVNKNIDPNNVAEYNVVAITDEDDGCDKLNKLIAEGWQVYRIQTELDWNIPIRPGLPAPQLHVTRAYLAKMRQ